MAQMDYSRFNYLFTYLSTTIDGIFTKYYFILAFQNILTLFELVVVLRIFQNFYIFFFNYSL